MATTACTEANISRELEEITNLYNFGLQLGIDSKVLDRIDRDHKNDIERQRTEIVKHWYRNTAESERTWERVADAIGKLGGHRNLEMKLRQLGTTLAENARGVLDMPQVPRKRDLAGRGSQPSPKRIKTDSAAGLKFDLESKRGLAIIVTCDYNGSLPTTNLDGDEMIKTLRDHFDYDVHSLRNKDATKKKVLQLLQQVYRYLKEYEGDKVNPNGRYKAIVFAFAGHGNSKDDKGDYIVTADEEHLHVVDEIVSAFVGIDGTVMKIPKLFFFDACRGNQWVTAALHRANEEDEINYRIDFSTLPEHKTPASDQWMCLVARKLRERDISLGDVMAEVKKEIYEQEQLYPQQPETKDRLVTGPLMLYHNKQL